jgi:mRNA interferase MazF
LVGNEHHKRNLLTINLEPTKGSETGKIRPCVVVTNNDYNRKVPVIQVVPITEWSEKKEAIITNVTIEPTSRNGLSKKSVADCLQTRPIDIRERLIEVKGHLDPNLMREIDNALKIVFAL